jgi:hypothetical protein
LLFYILYNSGPRCKTGILIWLPWINIFEIKKIKKKPKEGPKINNGMDGRMTE